MHVYKARASGGTVQDVYFSLHTVLRPTYNRTIVPTVIVRFEHR